MGGGGGGTKKSERKERKNIVGRRYETSADMNCSAAQLLLFGEFIGETFHRVGEIVVGGRPVVAGVSVSSLSPGKGIEDHGELGGGRRKISDGPLCTLNAIIFHSVTTASCVQLHRLSLCRTTVAYFGIGGRSFIEFDVPVLFPRFVIVNRFYYFKFSIFAI